MKSLDELDYYELLGVERGASADRVRDGFHRFAQSHHPDRHTHSALDVRLEAQKWIRRGTEAYRVLMNPDQRRAYDGGLSAGRLRFDPAVRGMTSRPSMTPDGVITTASARARPFLQKALDAMTRQDWASAKLNFQFVIQYDPDNDAVKLKLEELATRGLR